MAKNIKWVEGASGASPAAIKKISLLWMKPGELANVVELMVTGRGWNRKTVTKILGQCIIINIHMPGKNGYSEVLWNGTVQSMRHAYLRPTNE